MSVEEIQPNDKIVHASLSCPITGGSNNFRLTLFFDSGVPMLTDTMAMLSAEAPILPFEERQQMATLSMASIHVLDGPNSETELFRKRAKAQGFRQSDMSLFGIPNYTVHVELSPDDLKSLGARAHSASMMTIVFDQPAFGLRQVKFPMRGMSEGLADFIFQCSPQQ